MNQPSAPTTTAPTPAASPAEDNGTGVSYESNYEARVAQVFGPDPAPGDAKPAGEATDQPSSPSDASPAGSADDARRARLAKLQELSAKESASVDAKQRQKANADLEQRLAAAEKERDEARRMADQRIDFATLDERSFLEHAAKARVTPQRLAEWIKEQSANPELAASRAVDSAIGPKLSPLEQRLKDTEAKLESFLQAQQAQAVEAEEQAAYHGFTNFTHENAVTSPRAAAFLKEFGPAEYRKLVYSAAASVPPGAGHQGVLDHIEENLAALARIYAAPAASAKPSTPQPNPAAAKAMTTVSNTLAQTRASVVDEEAEWASLPFEERSARLFR